MAKTAADENFPVGSWLIARPLRPLVHDFYRFARTADDIADDPDLSADDKLARLDEMERRASELSPILRPHALDLLTAFRQDACHQPMTSWDDLMAYCRLSAAPVGRMMLDLHGEDAGLYAAADALCAALQVINHLQDCGEDARTLGRVYIPGAILEDLRAKVSSPALRLALSATVDSTRLLLQQAQGLRAIKSRRLRAEVAVIYSLAEALLQRLSRQDPLAERVRLSAFAKLRAVIRGLLA